MSAHAQLQPVDPSTALLQIAQALGTHAAPNADPRPGVYSIATNRAPNWPSLGIGHPTTEHGWRWLYRTRKEKGLEDAFVRVGRNILVDVPRYLELVRAQGGK
jgi:hypothetical protein